MSYQSLLSLMQLVSPGLPVGAFSYSEGLEALIEQQKIQQGSELFTWLQQELRWGSIRLEGAVLLRCYEALTTHDDQALSRWNAWLSALRDSEEIRLQNWQMGRSLARLLPQIATTPEERLAFEQGIGDLGEPVNFVAVFALAAHQWAIAPDLVLLGYLQSWVSNLISAAVRLVPLGQTEGQRLLQQLQMPLVTVVQELQQLPDQDLWCCSWGPALASMAHETQYSRLFRS
jgi:urease accessory protein